MNLTDMTAKAGLVTGAGGGIGRACALLLAQRGAAVVVSDINGEAAQQVAAEINAVGGKAIAFQCDVCEPDQVAALVALVSETFGRFDYAVNNAGVLGMQIPVDQYQVDGWNRVMNINLNGVFHCIQAELAVFYKQGYGAIVNTASEAALRGGASDAGYTASKHAVAGLTKTSALEAIKQGVRINAVCPGAIETPLAKAAMARAPQSVIDQAIATMPIGRFGQPEEVAEAIVWLCSDAASLVAGHLLAVDGGWAAH